MELQTFRGGAMFDACTCWRWTSSAAPSVQQKGLPRSYGRLWPAGRILQKLRMLVVAIGHLSKHGGAIVRFHSCALGGTGR